MVRLKRRRKVIIDNDRTQLTNKHIKQMLKDTSDIIVDRMHPAQWVEGQEEDSNRLLDLRTVLPYKRLLARPHLGDDGTLAPELLDLWLRSTARVQGKPYPFRMRHNTNNNKDARSSHHQGLVDKEGNIVVT